MTQKEKLPTIFVGGILSTDKQITESILTAFLKCTVDIESIDEECVKFTLDYLPEDIIEGLRMAHESKTEIISLELYHQGDMYTGLLDIYISDFKATFTSKYELSIKINGRIAQYDKPVDFSYRMDQREAYEEQRNYWSQADNNRVF